MKFDDLVVNYLGELGTYQKIQFFLVCLPTIITSMHALSWTFSGASVEHRCKLPSEVNRNTTYWTEDEKLLKRVEHCDLKDHPKWEHCPYAQCELGGELKKRCPDGYVFEKSVVEYSAIERWEIVCEWSVLRAFIQSMYYVGQMGGSLVFGFLGDRIGRKKVFFMAILIQIIAGLSMAIAPHWSLYAILRMAAGFAHPGIFVIAVVIGMELVGPSKRKIASVFTGMFFSFGQVILGGLAYFIRDYQYLQLAVALPSLCFIVYWWVIPESARWLVSQRRFEEADVILRRVAKANKTTLPDKWWEDVDEGTEDEKAEKSAADDAAFKNRRKHNFLDLFRTPKLRKISIAIIFCWPVVSMVYYGLSMNPNFLGGNLYVNFVFGGLTEIPAVLVVFFVVNVIGRKLLLCCGFLIASLCALSNLVLGDEVHWLVSLFQFLLAKGAITTTYATIYTFTPELFPTVIRNTAMGVCSMMARLGAILASFISMWLVDIVGKKAMIIPFATLGIMAALVAFLCLPETKGKELQETIEDVEGHGYKTAHELQPLSDGEAEMVKKDPEQQ